MTFKIIVEMKNPSIDPKIKPSMVKYLGNISHPFKIMVSSSLDFENS